MIDWCEKCEELMQPFLDGVLSQDEVAEAQRRARPGGDGAKSAPSPPGLRVEWW